MARPKTKKPVNTGTIGVKRNARALIHYFNIADIEKRIQRGATHINLHDVMRKMKAQYFQAFRMGGEVAEEGGIAEDLRYFTQEEYDELLASSDDGIVKIQSLGVMGDYGNALNELEEDNVALASEVEALRKQLAAIENEKAKASASAKPAPQKSIDNK